ncbi:MAG: helix-turn-helix domain-containing protein [Anaerovoracaceae bacterium]
MLNENIKAIRKSKGLSQEELAIKLNVVRQTISKWEQGLSAPDSDMYLSVCGHSNYFCGLNSIKKSLPGLGLQCS